VGKLKGLISDRLNLNPDLTPYTNQIEGGGNRGGNPQDIGFGIDFLDMTTKTQATKKE